MPEPGGRSAPRLGCSTPSGESDHLTRTAIGEHSKTGKAGQHHRPGGCLGGGNCHGVEKHAAVVAPNRSLNETRVLADVAVNEPASVVQRRSVVFAPLWVTDPVAPPKA